MYTIAVSLTMPAFFTEMQSFDGHNVANSTEFCISVIRAGFIGDMGIVTPPIFSFHSVNYFNKIFEQNC